MEQAGLGIESSDGGKVRGLLFADDFVMVSEFGEQLQKVIDVVHSYCRKWRLKANINKSAVMTFGKDSVEGSGKWGNKICQGYESIHPWGLILLRVVHGTCI